MANKPKHTSTKNSDNGKIILVVLALLLAVAFVAISIWQGTANFARWNFSGTKQEQPGGELNNGDSGLLAPDEHEANGISIKKMSIPVELYDDYGVSAAAETALQLTVTPTPADADMTGGKFSIAFKNASSTWAKGKTLSQYVTLSQSDTTHATISCLKAFGEQIIVTYTVAGENGNVTATYPLDYAKRILTGILDSDNNTGIVIGEGFAGELNLTHLNRTGVKFVVSADYNAGYDEEVTDYMSAYTVDDTFTIATTSTFKLTEEFKTACSSAKLTLPGASKTGSVSGGKLNATDGSASIISYYFGDTYKTEAFRNAVQACSSTGVFQVNITLQGTHSSYTFTAYATINVNTLSKAAQSVEWQSSGGNNSGHIF